MSKYKSREELYKSFLITNPIEWIKWIDSLTISGKFFTKPVYHLSGNENLAGIWTPRSRSTSTFSSKEYSKKFNAPESNKVLLDEPLPLRISGSLDVDKCYFGIYPTLWTYIFEDKMDSFKDKIDFDAYIYEFDYSDCRLILPETLQSEWLVHDAHESTEVVILGKPKAILKRKCKLVHEGINAKAIMYRPFNSKKYANTLLAYEMKLV